MYFIVVKTAATEWMDRWNKNGQIDDWMEGQIDRLKVNSQRFLSYLAQPPLSTNRPSLNGIPAA